MTIITEQEREAVYKTIYARRDVRSQFKSDPIPDDVLMRLLQAAHHAPSVGFMQPWDFIVIKDQAIKAEVKAGFDVANKEAEEQFDETRKARYKKFKLEGILEAPVNICITCDRTRNGPVVLGRTALPDMDLYSTVCATQNLWLAARAENIGVGWVSIIHNEALRKILNIPERLIPVAYLCLGYVTHFHEKPELEKLGWLKREDMAHLIHENRYQAR